MDWQAYRELIKDAEQRIGSYIASGGYSWDKYVKRQIEKIREWENAILAILHNQSEEEEPTRPGSLAESEEEASSL